MSSVPGTIVSQHFDFFLTQYYVKTFNAKKNKRECMDVPFLKYMNDSLQAFYEGYERQASL